MTALVTVLGVVALVWCIFPQGVRRGVAREVVAPMGRLVSDGMSAGNGVSEGEDGRLEGAKSHLLGVYEEENRELRRALGFVERNPDLLAAEVISRGGADAWSQRVRLGKGLKHGVELHAPVWVPEGLVGHVIEVTEGTSDVLLLSDPNSHVACEVEDSDGRIVRGILSGTGHATPWNVALDGVSPPLKLDYLDRHSQPVAGATIRTSGLGGIYPRGVPVGVVDELAVDTSGYYRRASARPLASLDGLRVVFVLMGWEGTR